MTPPALAAVLETEAPSLTDRVAQRTVCLSLRRGTFGNRRQASLATVTTDADKALIGLRKTLLVSPELNAILRHDTRLTDALNHLRLPAPYKYFSKGQYLLAVGTVLEADRLIKASIAGRAPLIDAAVATYQTRIAETSARLESLAVATDYPSPEAFRATFYVEYAFQAIQTPTTLATLNPELMAEEKAKAVRHLQAMAADCQKAMRVGMQALVDKLVTDLTPGPDGKPRRFEPSVVTHVTDFLRTFDMKNDALSDDALAALARQAKAILAGTDPAILKSDPGSRVQLASSFAAIQTALRPLVGRRAISFDDEVA